MSYRVLVINPGSTSTKFAVYEDENPILVKGIEHNADEISKFNNILDQYEMRKEQIQKVLYENNIDLNNSDYDGRWMFEEKENEFILYQNGEYNSNHFIVSLEQRELEQELSKKKEKEVQDGTVL